MLKELYVNLQDTRTRIFLLAPPLIQLFIFTFAATLDVKNVSMGVLNRDGGTHATELIERFQGSKTFTHITPLKNEAEMRQYLDHQKGIFVLYIDQTFSKAIEDKKIAKVEILLDGRKSNTAQIVLGYAMTIVEGMSPPSKISVVNRYWFNPNLYYYWYNIPSLVATLSMLICIVITSISLAREKELGTYDQLLISPLRPFEIILGKILPGVLIGFLEGILMAVCGVWILGVPFHGSVLLFLPALFLFVFSISGTGIFISALASSQQQAMLGAFVLIAPSILLSGFATPIETMPTWLQPITSIIPLKYMLIISKGLFLKAMAPSTILNNCWPLVIIGCVNFLGAVLFFKNRLAKYSP